MNDEEIQEKVESVMEAVDTAIDAADGVSLEDAVKILDEVESEVQMRLESLRRDIERKKKA